MLVRMMMMIAPPPPLQADVAGDHDDDEHRHHNMPRLSSSIEALQFPKSDPCPRPFIWQRLCSTKPPPALAACAPMSFFSGVGTALGFSREKSALSQCQMFKHFKATYAAATCDVSVDEWSQVRAQALSLCAVALHG